MLSIVMILLCVLVYAQELPKIIPASPNASSLGEFGKIPVGLFTGTPQVNIPIDQFNEGGLTVPISLSYSSNGVRVDQTASNVGLGWTLNAGGVITRVIMDDADEAVKIAMPANFPGGGTQEILNYLKNATNSEDGYDTLSDIYSFNFIGYTGKFFLDENRVPVLINPSPLKIEKSPNSTYAFKITDSKGTIFWFGSENSTERTMQRSTGGGHSLWSLEVDSSWYLSKIESITGQEINFNYTNFSKTYNAALSQRVIATANGNTPISPGQNLIFSSVRTRFSQLSSIVSSIGEVNFTYSSNTTGFNKLDVIELKNSNNNLVKKYLLDYNIVASILLSLKNSDKSYEDRYGKRLFLKSVTEVDNQGVLKKPYLLSYYSPDKIPPMFSYAQDYWGFYNGVHSNRYLVSGDNHFFYSASNNALLKNVFSNVIGDKKPNGVFGVNGMLKKIIYPTAGFNEFLYEPHSFYGTETILPSKTNLGIHIQNGEDVFNTDPTIKTTNTILFSQNKTPLYFSVGRGACWPRGNGGKDWPTHHIRSSLSVKVANEGSNVFESKNILYNVSAAGNMVNKTSNISVTENNGMGRFYIDLKEGKRYQFSLRVGFECVRGDFNFPYYDKPSTEIETNIEVGGVRLKEVITKNGEGKEEVKKYHYGDLACLDCSSGKTEKPIPAIAYTINQYGSTGPFGGTIIDVVDSFTLSSSNMYNLYTKQGSHIGYESVIEGFGGEFKGGGVLHKYNIPSVINSNPIKGTVVVGTPFTNNFGTGQELETLLFRKVGDNYIPTQEKINNYSVNTALNRQYSFYNFHLRETFSGMPRSVGQQISYYDITEYYMRSQWHRLISTLNKDYDINGLNPITTRTNYFYENTDHLQPTRIETTNSKGELLKTETKYAHDVNNTRLINENRIAIPLESKTYKKLGSNPEALLSNQKTIYSDNHNSASLYLPSKIQVSKGSRPLEDRVIYHSYDDKGNPSEVSKKDGTHIVYIWGYNKTQPIAKIENATLTNIASNTITSLQNLSNLDKDVVSENTLRTALNTLRGVSTLSKSKITTFTYNSLIGVTSITDPRGKTVYYEYDSFNRLQYVKDAQKNILKENKYNYKN